MRRPRAAAMPTPRGVTRAVGPCGLAPPSGVKIQNFLIVFYFFLFLKLGFRNPRGKYILGIVVFRPCLGSHPLPTNPWYVPAELGRVLQMIVQKIKVKNIAFSMYNIYEF